MILDSSVPVKPIVGNPLNNRQSMSGNGPGYCCIALLSLLLIAGCEQPGGAETAPVKAEFESLFQALYEQTIHEAGFPVRDLSAPFENVKAAKERLEIIAEVVAGDTDGTLVMHCYDDTLKRTSHVFTLDKSSKRYTKIIGHYGQVPQHQSVEFNSAGIESSSGALLLQTPAGVIRIDPVEVTPWGA